MNIDPYNVLKRCASVPTMINNTPPHSLINNSTTTFSSIHDHIQSLQMASTTTSPNNNTIPNSPSAANRDNVSSIYTSMRARRHSASFSPHVVGGTGPRLTPRVSQLRQEECADITNSREVNHERETHSAIQMSQSWEDLTLVTENWSCKNDDLIANPLQVILPVGPPTCSSPSPTRYDFYFYTHM